MANLPTLKVLLDDGTGSFPYNITPYVLATDGYQVTRGRDDWQSAVTAGELSLTLNNSDGRFSPGSTLIASPSPIVVDRRIRLQEIVNGTTFTRFTGYVKSWPVEWPETVATFAKVRLTATDAQARAERRPLRSNLEEEVVADSPTAYYTLGEPTGAVSGGDTSGRQSPPLVAAGTGTAVSFGTGTGPADSLPAAQMTAGQYLAATGSTAYFGAAAWSVECWIRVATPPASVMLVWAAQSDSVFQTSLTISAAGLVISTGVGAVGPNVCDGLTHQIVVTNNGTTSTVYVDGVSVGSGAATFAFAPPTLTVGQVFPGLLLGFTGTISHVATFSTVLTAGRVTSHYSAGRDNFAGESGTARMTRLAGYAGITTGSLDTSLTNIAGDEVADSTAWAEIQAAADAEMGVAYIDGSGALTFHNRNRVVAKTTPDLTLTSQWVTPDVTPVLDDQQLTNYLEVTAERTGVKSLARNGTSETSHGRYSGSRSYLVLTDAEALDRANWLLGDLAEPTTRYGTLTINLYNMTPAQASTVLTALEVDCWLRITSMAPQNPGGTTADVIVQAWQENVSAENWTITCNVVARSLFSPVWILDNTTFSVLDSTTRLYV